MIERKYKSRTVTVRCTFCGWRAAFDSMWESSPAIVQHQNHPQGPEHHVECNFGEGWISTISSAGAIAVRPGVFPDPRPVVKPVEDMALWNILPAHVRVRCAVLAASKVKKVGNGAASKLFRKWACEWLRSGRNEGLGVKIPGVPLYTKTIKLVLNFPVFGADAAMAAHVVNEALKMKPALDPFRLMTEAARGRSR